MALSLSPVLLLLASFAAGACAQTIGQNKEAGPGTYTLSVNAQLVIETITVRNQGGNPVQELTANDFTITEDGAPQKIRFCEHQTLGSVALPSLSTPSAQSTITVYKHLSRSQLAPETPETLRYKDRRLLAFYFDMTAMSPPDQTRALQAAQTFIRTQMTAADLVSVLRYGGGSVDVLQDFTADRNRLLSILETMSVGEGQGEIDSIQDASSADTGAAFGQDDGEFNVFNTDRQLAALQTAAKMLGQLNEKKALVYFAGGLRLNGLDNQAQLHATVDAAIRAGVSFWPVDTRGLVATPPMGDASHGSPGNVGMYSGSASQAVQLNLQRSQDTLFALAGDTGGKALLDNNDLTKGILDAQRSISDYYVVGYYTSHPALDGRFRRVKITLSHNATASLDYRQGYYAGKVFGKFTAADKERQLEDALMLDEPITELTIAMEIDFFQLNRAEYFVPIVVKIPGRELSLAKRGGAEHTLIDFVAEIKDLYGGSTVSNVRDNVNIKLTEATAAELAHRPIEYDSGFTLLPGKYSIKFLARDNETGRMGTYQTTFTIPNLNKEERRVPVSSVVLSSQRVNLKDAVFDAMKTKDQAKETAVNPLVADGYKLVPSVTRVFSRDRQLYVYLQAYEAGSAAKPLVAYVTFYRNDVSAWQTKPIAILPTTTGSVRQVPFMFSIALDHLTVGDYDCQVTILDPSEGKSTFWRSPLRIVP